LYRISRRALVVWAGGGVALMGSLMAGRDWQEEGRSSIGNFPLPTPHENKASTGEGKEGEGPRRKGRGGKREEWTAQIARKAQKSSKAIRTTHKRTPGKAQTSPAYPSDIQCPRCPISRGNSCVSPSKSTKAPCPMGRTRTSREPMWIVGMGEGKEGAIS
jgi:hypothetical protein